MAQREIKRWITINGKHIPIFEGESEKEAVSRATTHSDSKSHKAEGEKKEDWKEKGPMTQEEYEEKHGKKTDEQKDKEKDFEEYTKVQEGMRKAREDKEKDENAEHMAEMEHISKDEARKKLDGDKDKSSNDIDEDKLDEIAERYNTSKPVSGNWDTEVEHEQKAIAKEFGISMDEAKQVMKDKLGFDDEQFESNEQRYDLGGNPIYSKADAKRLDTIEKSRGKEDGSVNTSSKNYDPDEGYNKGNDDKLWEVAERYNTSKPVSGSWDTEVEHEQKALSKELNISMDEAKQVMKDYLGFEDKDFKSSSSTGSSSNKQYKPLSDEENEVLKKYFDSPEGKWAKDLANEQLKNGEDWDKVTRQAYGVAAKSIKIGDKEVAVHKEPTTAKERLAEGRKEAAAKHDSIFGSNTKTAKSNIENWSRSELMTAARKLGIPSRMLRETSTEQLRARLLAIYKGSHK